MRIVLCLFHKVRSCVELWYSWKLRSLVNDMQEGGKEKREDENSYDEI